MGTQPSKKSASLRGERRSELTERRARHAPGTPRLTTTLNALDELARAGVQIGIHVSDVETGHTVLSADAHVPMPIAGLGVLPVLLEVTTQMHEGALEPQQRVRRPDERVPPGGIWRYLAADDLELGDVAALAATTSDPTAANALLDLVGYEAVTRRMSRVGMVRSAILDRFRDRRGPDDAPHAAIGTAREYAEVFQRIARADGIPRGVSDEMTALLALHPDATLVGAPMAADPFPDAGCGLSLRNLVGRGSGMRAEAGLAMGRSAALAYALFLSFDDSSLIMRHHAHKAFHLLGEDILEIVA